jgi:hypothetical protein
MIYNLSYLLSYFNLIACYFNLGVEFITVKLGYHHSYLYQYSLRSLLSNSDLPQLYAISESIKKTDGVYVNTNSTTHWDKWGWCEIAGRLHRRPATRLNSIIVLVLLVLLRNTGWWLETFFARALWWRLDFGGGAG